MRLNYSKFELIPIASALVLAASSLAGIAHGDNKSWWPLCFFAPCTLILLAAPAIRARREQTRAKAGPGLAINAIGVRRTQVDDDDFVRWDELTEVSIVTTSAGPFMDDVFFVLRGAGENGVVVPQELAMEHKLLDVLQARLPNLDNTAVISAMGCTDDARFVIWPPQQAQ